METIVSTVITGVVTLAVCLITNHAGNKKLVQEASDKASEQARLENEAQKRGLQALLRDRLYSTYNKHIASGYAPIYAKENFENMYQQYHNLGANGVMDQIHEEFMNLPTEGGESHE